MTKKRAPCLMLVLLFALALVLVFVATIVIPWKVSMTIGPPSSSLSFLSKVNNSLELVWVAGKLTRSMDPSGTQKTFTIKEGESAADITDRLKQEGFICCAQVLRSYLSWSGLDKTIQTGTFRLSPGQTGLEIAATLASKSKVQVEFSVLAGWRMEEIAASLPTSGLAITPAEFLHAAASTQLMAEYIPPGKSTEGFLHPRTYLLDRNLTAGELVAILLQGFYDSLPVESAAGFANNGMTPFEAVTLASIIQREAVVEEEMPMIASVFQNRLAAGMKLQSDPTVQYALGYDQFQGTWWKTPLGAEDLLSDSPYNTYLYPNLPPGPICNPGMAALQAVAFPAQSNYFYFQARCDASGLHNFTETYEQHLANNCP
jgi:UPF0755 protein